MKRYDHLYEKLLDFANILNIYEKQIKPNTKNKDKIEKYEHYLLLNLKNIQTMLLSRKIEFHDYYIFLIREPKYRIVMSQQISDKIINHLIAKYLLLDVFEPSLIDGNVATRKNKGTLYGVNLVKKYIHSMKTKGKKIYYLKCDIQKYFYMIDHNQLMKVLKSKIKDQEALWLLEKVIETSNQPKIKARIQSLKAMEIERIQTLSISEKEKLLRISEVKKIPDFSTPNKGIPIGNMTSQALAIIYLNGLDHYIKEDLHIKCYVRYMDGATV